MHNCQLLVMCDDVFTAPCAGSRSSHRIYLKTNRAVGALNIHLLSSLLVIARHCSSSSHRRYVLACPLTPQLTPPTISNLLTRTICPRRHRRTSRSIRFGNSFLWVACPVELVCVLHHSFFLASRPSTLHCTQTNFTVSHHIHAPHRHR